MMDYNVDQYISVSGRIRTDDIDWEAARKVGLTEDEVFMLTYFSDVECHTVRYLSELLGWKFAMQQDVGLFLVTWCYEEFNHGRALIQLMNECGHSIPKEESRIAELKSRATLKDRLHDIIGWPISRIFSEQFPAIYATFGAVGEITTLCGYERLEQATANPALKILCERIAKQERRHMAWYFNTARARLAVSPTARLLTRKFLNTLWSPVGGGIKSNEDIRRLFNTLFPGDYGKELVERVDTKTNELPGMDGVNLMQTYYRKQLAA